MSAQTQADLIVELIRDLRSRADEYERLLADTNINLLVADLRDHRIHRVEWEAYDPGDNTFDRVIVHRVEATVTAAAYLSDDELIVMAQELVDDYLIPANRLENVSTTAPTDGILWVLDLTANLHHDHGLPDPGDLLLRRCQVLVDNNL